jgi:hypothetical protein
MILYGSYKIQQFTTTIEDSLLRLGPWKELDPHRYTLGSRIRTWKEMGPSNWVPGPMEAAGSPESGGFGGTLGRGSGGKGCGAHHGSIHGQRRERGSSGEGARRCRPAPAAGARAPANGQCGLVDTRAGGVEYVLGRVSGGSHGAGDEKNRGCSGGF